MNRYVVLAAMLAGCRDDAFLGTRDPAMKASSTDAAVPCPVTGPDEVLASFDPSFGELRVMATRDGITVAAFDRPDGAGTVAIASRGDATFTELARISADPVSIAFDGTFAYVACRASGQVYRVQAGEANVATLQPGVSSVTVTDGRAYWTVPARDSVVSGTFDRIPAIVTTFPRAQSVEGHERTLFIAGEHELAVLHPGEPAPTRLANVCGPGTLAVDSRFVFCVDDGVLKRVDVQTRNVVSLPGNVRGTTSVVVARGRVFYRTEQAIEAVPIDAVGGPTIAVRAGKGPSAIATDGCGLYYAVGRFLNRHAL